MLNRISGWWGALVIAAGALFSWPGLAAPSPETPPALEQRLALPAHDDGLPGAGPIRRYDWFKNLWLQRRTLWAKQVEQDQNAVVFLGDSITQGWGEQLKKHFPGLKAANRGISGDTTRGVLIRLKEDVLALNPKGVVLLIGTNDLEEGADPETIAANLKLILGELKRHNPRMPILLCQVFPSSATKKRPADKIRRINELYAAAVKGDPQVTLLDTYTLFANAQGDAKPEEFPDLLHPNAAGYAKWAGVLKTELVRLQLWQPAAPVSP
ncbi:SGNH/GDSL hydrolase family protein [Fontisphaera persica]|uniref:SGNH/GDSL hydrolase family protein n=1 Tax=Fontisphaera persica TaxID=2974023 RepID=UPI0024BF64FB|nr:SGNH/GDSL hydrolase family protein [Fontisphaera persica]WCJ59774.1 SGNH/GDSL hydrolase family protein [Fontisphaera persica]